MIYKKIGYTLCIILLFYGFSILFLPVISFFGVNLWFLIFVILVISLCYVMVKLTEKEEELKEKKFQEQFDSEWENE